MWKKSSGVFMGVEAGWQLDDRDPVDQRALSKAFDELREEAASEGCVSFPTREDCAAHPVLFEELRRRYVELTGRAPDRDIFRRHVCTIHKEGGTPD